MRALLVIAVLGLAGCGSQEPAPNGQGATTPDATRLVINVWPEGKAARSERRVVTSVPKAIRADDFAPVPRGTACAEVYGGPAEAEVTGRLRGRPINAKFNRVNACEIARWDRVDALLGRAPGVTTP